MGSINYPLLLQPRIDAKIWGGRRLETVLGKSLPTPDRFGESLESDGASRVSAGAATGMTIEDLIRIDAAGLLGERGLSASTPFGDFPLLAKFIDANEVLSVQVHPNDEQAAELDKRGKTEAWYIIAAEPEASLIVGVRENMTLEDIESAIKAGTLDDLLVFESVEPGETFFVPAGTTHAIGAGVLLYEIQQSSDVTYRMYDWNRFDDQGNPRALHVQDSLRVVKPAQRAQRISPLALSRNRTVLTACRYFALERWTIGQRMFEVSHDGQSFRLVSAISGEVVIETINGDVSLETGRTALIPATAKIIRIHGTGTLLASYIPDLNREIIRPLLKAGHDPDEIVSLSGNVPEPGTPNFE